MSQQLEDQSTQGPPPGWARAGEQARSHQKCRVGRCSGSNLRSDALVAFELDGGEGLDSRLWLVTRKQGEWPVKG